MINKIKKNLEYIILIIIFTMILIVSGIILINTEGMKNIVEYGNPICISDGTIFEDESCKTCGKSIIGSGVLVKQMKYENDIESKNNIEFKTLFDSYATYHKILNNSLVFSSLFILSILGNIVVCIVYIIKHKNKLNT